MLEFGLLLGAVGLMLGGILKGATGAGAPLLAVPLLAVIYDVPFAVAVFTIPSLLSNIWQGWHFRAFQGSPSFVFAFAGAAAVGAAVGSVLLVTLSASILFAAVGAAVFLYIAFRIARPEWVLGERIAQTIVGPVGFMSGVMQGAVGISAPISLTFLNAMRLPRERFIAVVSVFFAAMAVVQIVALIAVGVLTAERAVISLAASAPLFGGMPIGAWLGKRFSRETFDKVMLAILAVVSLRLFVEAVVG
ncbi:MAG: sulfite exporter TauE/SafE family protein [Pseudomonadota bacterium]